MPHGTERGNHKNVVASPLFMTFTMAFIDIQSTISKYRSAPKKMAKKIVNSEKFSIFVIVNLNTNPYGY